MSTTLFSPCAGSLGEDYGVGGFGFGGYGGAGKAVACYANLLTSQYKGANAPNLQAFLALLLQPFVDAAQFALTLYQAFNLNPALGPVAQGVQLDAIGTLVGASRTLPFTPTTTNSTSEFAITASASPASCYPYINMNGLQAGDSVLVDTGGNQETVTVISVYVFDGYTSEFEAVFTKNHVAGCALAVALTPVLTDPDYLTLLQAKILQNQWDGQAGSLWQPWQVMFPGGHIYITDNQNMTCTIFLVGAFSALQLQMIENGLIVPRPEAVQYTFEFGTLPIFGFGSLNPAFIGGFGIGNWGGVA